ncbi:MAG: tetratricopeptide repeat protein [Oscillospiraceae bacterium]|nr:tetratricopeptide repeat protein [Oscillospiraceae bacterium]
MRRKLKNNILFQPVKVKDYSKFFVALGKATLYGVSKEFDKSALSFMDAGAALGLDETDERLAWKLLDRSIVHAITDLVSESKNSIPQSDEETFIANIKKFKYNKEIEIDPDFFERPKECQFIKDLQEVFREWLVLAGVDANKTEAIVHRLPGFFVYSLHSEWCNNPEKYRSLLSESPFSGSVQMEEEWDRYKAYLEKQIQERIFDEVFSLAQIFVPLCGYFNKITEHAKDTDRKESGTQLDLDSIPARKTQKIVVDLETCIHEWISKDDNEDAIRVISGGPGSGKSSFVKMLAASISTTHDVLFIPLYKLDLRRDVKEVVGEFLVSNRVFHKNPIGESEQLLIIFDGLDEIMQQGKASIDAGTDFTNQILQLLRDHNSYDRLQIRVIITGRDLPVQAIDTNLRREGQILHVLPYYVDQKKSIGIYFEDETYFDPDGLLKDDKRRQWWVKYGKLTGGKYAGLPSELDRSALEDITAQPLLNYLLALSFERKEVHFSQKMNLNEIYNDLIDAVYERGWQSQRHKGEPVQPGHPTIQGVEKDDYDRVLEEIAVSAWQGAGRTATLQDIEKRCANNKLKHVLERFQEQAKEGVTNLLTAFYFREADTRDPDGDKTFEFTHKNFGEYLAARRIVRQLSNTKTALDQSFGWTVEIALEHWIHVCSRVPIDEYIFQYLCNEIERNKKADVKRWQQMLCELIAYMLKNGMPYDKVPQLTFVEKVRFSRNSEEALLAALSACSRYTKEISKIDWPGAMPIDFPHITSAGEWLSKLSGQRRGTNIAISCLNHLDLSRCILHRRDLYRANLEHSSLKNCDLDHAILAEAKLHKADLSGSRLRNANLRDADLRKVFLETERLSFDGVILDDVKADDAQIYFTRGIAHRYNNNYSKAEKEFNKAIELVPDNAQYYNCRGVNYRWSNKHRKAIVDHTKAIDLAPDNAQYFHDRGASYSWLREHGKASADYTKAIELAPNNAGFYSDRGNNYRWLREYEKAVADHTKAVELVTWNTEYKAELAFAQYKVGDIDLAFRNLDSALCMNNPSFLAYRNSGVIRLKVAKKKQERCGSEVLDMLNKAIKLTEGRFDWGSSLSYMRRAEYYLYTNELDTALADLNHAIVLNEDNDQAWFYLSKYYEQTGDTQQSALCLSRAKAFGYTLEDDD